ncbi:hypothetical protein Taro_048850 [Colocasia esculenta]|uniref:Uncharacterized protein n=1 Tax=Colocasia esculenta TaxID=4460 RepID=A0A843X9C0_COLES|nr:hypothetical protein [Colocasia esculenta]
MESSVEVFWRVEKEGGVKALKKFRGKRREASKFSKESMSKLLGHRLKQPDERGEGLRSQPKGNNNTLYPTRSSFTTEGNNNTLDPTRSSFTTEGKQQHPGSHQVFLHNRRETPQREWNKIKPLDQAF